MDQMTSNRKPNQTLHVDCRNCPATSEVTVRQNKMKAFITGYSISILILALAFTVWITFDLSFDEDTSFWLYLLPFIIGLKHIVLCFPQVYMIDQMMMKRMNRTMPFYVEMSKEVGFITGIIGGLISYIAWDYALSCSVWFLLLAAFSTYFFPAIVYHQVILKHINRSNKSWHATPPAAL